MQQSFDHQRPLTQLCTARPSIPLSADSTMASELLHAYNCRITGKELLNELEDDNWWHSLQPHYGSRAAAQTLSQALHQVNDGLHSIVKTLSPELAPLFAVERGGERQALHTACFLLHFRHYQTCLWAGGIACI